jgi:hypothetical protein
MQLALAIAVALLVVGVVAWPLLAGGRRPAGLPAEEPNSASLDQTALETVYEAIRTLQVEHDLGRIADDDFRAQLAEYRREAALILRELDRRGNYGPSERS